MKLKYRAWHKPNKIMLDVIAINFSLMQITADIETSKIYQELDYWWNETEIPFSEIVLMQSTGLKDKNGKEIYEGDICKWRDLETFNDEVLEDIFVVVWNDEKLAWYAQDEDGNFGYGLYEYTDDIDLEIIGNIYENSELLEV